MVHYIFICFADGALGAERKEKKMWLQQYWLPPSDIVGMEKFHPKDNNVMLNWMFTEEVTRKV